MIYKGLETTPEFRSIAPVLESWTNLYEKTAEAFPQKDDFWFTEPGHVSILCAASWLMNIPAATEVPTKKRGRTNSSPFDILLSIGNVKIAGEAKYADIYGTGSLDPAVRELTAARKAASELPQDLANHRLGILFALFWGKRGPDESLVGKTIERFRAEYPVGIAWSITAPKSHQAKEYSPGAFMVFSKPC